ncbi:unnamed protein product, partial [Brassica oleracea]
PILTSLVLCKTGITHQFIGFMVKEYRICSMRFHLHGVGSSIKDIGNLFNQVEICNIVHCDGLLLCVTKEDKRLMVWNPYLGQTRCIQIQPVNNYYRLESSDKYAFGYDNKNHNPKILRFLDVNRYEIYDFSSNSWRILDIIPYDDIWYRGRGASLKGNTQSIIIPHILNGSYFVAKEKTVVNQEEIDELHNFLLCFDFTRERFGPFLPLPFLHYNEDIGNLSTLRDEKLVVLYQRTVCPEVEILVITNIEPDAVSWTPFLNIDMEPLDRGFKFGLCSGASFFNDEEMKIAVVFYICRAGKMAKTRSYHSICIFGENGCLDNLDLGDAVYRHVPMRENPYCCPLVCSYVPSLVQIN